MSQPLDPEDARLDALWRARFGEPLPIRGGARFARAILGEEANFAEPSPGRMGDLGNSQIAALA
jgi:hypothetical protein